MTDRRPTPAVTRLVQEHYEFLYRYAYRLCGSVQDAEDLTQQAFLSAHRSLDQLRNPEHARAWLSAILRNAFRRRFRSPGVGKAVPLDSIQEPTERSPADHPIESEELQAALLELPEEFRSPLILYYLEHLDYRRIAATLEIPIGTVMSRLSRGKAHLRERLMHYREPAVGSRTRRSDPEH